ncbi:MAG TPA: PAS domain S-box protein [Pirellulales bacterium]|jgi:PAS domain S-box-containing protein|nr:PAS domain S-box protein [Pirellulales bacterium]
MSTPSKTTEPVVAGARFVGTAPPAPLAADSSYRRQAALVALGRRAVAPPDVALLVQDAAALIAETLGADHYGAAELNAARTKLILRLAATADEGAKSNGSSGGGLIERQVEFDKRSSLAAYALKTAQVVVVSDLAKNAPTRDPFLSGQGIRSALIVPLQMVDQSYGALGAFSDRPREFTPEDMLFAEAIAHLVSTTLSRDRAQRELADERRFTKTVLATLDALVLILDPRGQIVSINAAAARTTGFTSAELIERSVWNTLLVHDEVAMMRTAIESVCKATEPVECESLVLTKAGERRSVRWNLAATRGSSGNVESIIGTGIDITDQRLFEERLDRIEAELRQSAAADSSEPTPAQFRPLPAGPHGERRKGPRRSFNYLQRIAPMVNGNLPDRGHFHVVPCHDISSGGFSFISTHPPGHSSFVVALGTSPVLIYLIARVAHVTSVQQDEKTRYLVGCEYVGRADYGINGQS